MFAECVSVLNLNCSALWNGNVTKIFDFVCDSYPNIGICLPCNRFLAEVSSAQAQDQHQLPMMPPTKMLFNKLGVW